MKFEKERTQPAIDLIQKITSLPKTILDIGCGPGNSTQQLWKCFPSADILGVDSSEDMLRRAKRTYRELHFEALRIPDELGKIGTFDLIFSNACLHWIPDHQTLLPQIMNHLNAGGVFAVQILFIQQAVFYRELQQLTQTPKWEKLKEICIFHAPMPCEIYDILSKTSGHITMWETTYYHVVSSYKDVMEWYKGSGLRPYLASLRPQEQEELMKDLSKRLQKIFPLQADDSVILKMPRIFYLAVKNG